MGIWPTRGSCGSCTRYDGLSQNFVPDQQMLLAFESNCCHITVTCGLYFAINGAEMDFYMFLREFGCIREWVWGGGLLGSMISQL